MKHEREAPASLGKRLAWLVIIWALSVGALAIVAGAIKLIMSAAGLTI